MRDLFSINSLRWHHWLRPNTECQSNRAAEREGGGRCVKHVFHLCSNVYLLTFLGAILFQYKFSFCQIFPIIIFHLFSFYFFTSYCRYVLSFSTIIHWNISKEEEKNRSIDRANAGAFFHQNPSNNLIEGQKRRRNREIMRIFGHAESNC